MSKKAKLITIFATVMVLSVQFITVPIKVNAEQITKNVEVVSDTAEISEKETLNQSEKVTNISDDKVNKNDSSVNEVSDTKGVPEQKMLTDLSDQPTHVTNQDKGKNDKNDVTTNTVPKTTKTSEKEKLSDLNAEPEPVIKQVVSNTKGVPVQGTLTKDKWSGECDYTIKMSLWYGNNADSWKLYENGKLIYEENLVNNSPSAQVAQKTFKDKPNGEYIYTAELINSFGTTVLTSSVTQKVTENKKPIDIDLPNKAAGTPAVAYKVLSEDDNTIQWAVAIANPNKNYTWAGNDFSAWGVKFNTSAKVVSVDNAANFKQDGNKVTINLKQDERLLGPNTTKIFIVKAEKQGNSIAPTKLVANQIRGNVPYPNYSKLPSSWTAGKTDLKASDLIDNEKAYYDSNVSTNTGNKLISYSPSSPTQITMGLPNKMPGPINGVNGLKVWMPSKYLAMGIATDQEVFKLNPNYMVGLSIKENFSCGLIPLESGDTRNIVTVDGEKWSWPIEKKHPDGPFQQEKGNFNEVKKQYIDYLSPNAEHQDIVTLKTGEIDDPSYVSAAISSAISITMTREFLYAIPKNDFEGFLKQSKDPWAEFVLVDNAYNRGVFGLLQKNIFTSNREGAIKSTDLSKDYQLGGYASHIDTIKAIISEMDKEKDNVYDEKLTKTEVDNYLKELRKFYQNGTPTDSEWNAMVDDVHRAYDVLSKHWGDNTISYRYDFLTILRVAREHLPDIANPAPSGPSWVEQVSSANR